MAHRKVEKKRKSAFKMELRGITVLVVFLAVTVSNAEPAISKVPSKTDLATYVGVATGLSQVPKIKIIAEPTGSLQMSSDGDDNCYTVPKGTNLTLVCTLTYWGRKSQNKRRHKENKEMRHIGRHILGWAFPGAENQHKEVLRYYPHGRGTTVENVLQINNVHDNDTGNYVCYCKTKRGLWDGLNAFFIDVEPPQPKVHVYAVPKFSMKAHSPGENRHYIVKEGSNVSLTCETSFLNKNLLINWVHPKAENQYEVKQIHSRHDGKNIKERILHIKNAQAEDSGTYTCHTRSLHQKTWGSPNTFYIQVGEQRKVENIDAIQKPKMHNPEPKSSIKINANTTPSTTTTAAAATTTTAAAITTTTTKAPTTTSTPSTTKTSRPTTTPVVTTTTTTKSTSLPPSTQAPPPASNKFDVGSFFGGMAVVVGVLLLLKLIQVIIQRRRQQSYGYLNM